MRNVSIIIIPLRFSNAFIFGIKFQYVLVSFNVYYCDYSKVNDVPCKPFKFIKRAYVIDVYTNILC